MSEKIRILVLMLIGLFAASCNLFETKSEFAAKKKIGTCQENQGMVTFEAQLYSDSTFYIASDGILDYSYGRFHIQNDTVSFDTNGGTPYLCSSYHYNRNNGRLKPISCTEPATPVTVFLSFIGDTLQ